jgi:hypothetical protein
MQTHPKNTRSFRGNAALLASVLLLNLTFASLAYAAAVMEWSPTTGLVVGNAAGSEPSTDEQVMTQIARSDLSGTPYYYVSWYEQNSGDIKITRYNASGVEQNGFPVTLKDNGAEISAGLPRIVSDNNGGAIVAWSDDRNYVDDENGYDLFGERVNSAGARQWNPGTPNGILLAESGFSDMIGDAVADGNGGIAITYAQDHSLMTKSDDYPFVIRINNDGTPTSGWPANGRSVVNVEDTNNCISMSELHMIAVPDDTAETADTLPEYMVYFGMCNKNDPGSDVGKILSDGNAAWAGPVTIPISYKHPAEDRIISDGNGGAYVFYFNSDLWFGVNVESNGVIDTVFGTPSFMSYTNAYDDEVNAIDDGNGGGVIVTTSNNGGVPIIRATRFDDQGNDIWNQVVNIENGARDPAVIRDASGNFLVLWKNETLDQIHFQRLNAATGVQQYASDLLLSGTQVGASVTPEPHRSGFMPGGMSTASSMALTNNNEAFVVWDQVNVSNYMQKVNLLDGTLQLDANGQVIAANNPVPKNQSSVGGTRTSDGNYILFWHDASTEIEVGMGPINVFAEKFSPNGTRLWNPTHPGIGVQVATDYDNISNFRVVPTTDGGAITAWEKSPTSGAASEIYAQRVDADGNAQWGSDGTQVSGNGPFMYSESPQIVADGSNGAYISWLSTTDGGQDYVIVSHILNDSTIDPAWDGGFATEIDNYISSSGNIQRMLSVDNNNLVVAYNAPSFTGSFLKAAKIQKADGTLAASWGSNPLIFSVPQQLYQQGMNVAPDNAGGVYIAFSYQDMDFSNVGVQHISVEGTVDFPTPNGIVVGDQDGVQMSPQIVSDNNGTQSGAIIAWTDERGARGVGDDVYAQRIDKNGTELWTANGVAITNTGDSLSQMILQFDSGDTISAATSNGGYGIIVPFYSETADPDVTDIYAQHLNSNGVAQWAPNGELVESFNTNPDIDLSVQAISDGNGGAVITWSRSTDFGNTYDLFAQYLSDTVGGICTEGGATSFCGQQEINTASLSFTSIPDSFIFPNITATSLTQNIFNNGVANPPTTSGEDHDLLTVLDTRGDPSDGGLGGGFTVQVNNSTNFTDGSNIIPINNLFTVTSTDDTSLAGTVATNGVMYDNVTTIPAGTRNISAPVDAGNLGTTLTLADLQTANTYTDIFPGLPNPRSQFGGGDITLMDGTLSAAQGRNGSMYQFVNYYLTLPPANQISGSYSVILTFTLFDSTT